MDPITLHAWLLGPALAILLYQRGLLVLHASVLAREDRAVAILGDCGAGKSTLAFVLCQRGWRLVADDQAAIVWHNGRPFVHPGRPLLRVSRDTLMGLGVLPPPGTVECDAKLLVQAANPARTATALSHLYVLSDAEQIRSSPLTPQEGFASLVRHLFVGSLLTSARSRARHFHQCVALAQESPVRRLERPRSLAVLPDLARTINDDLALCRP